MAQQWIQKSIIADGLCLFPMTEEVYIPVQLYHIGNLCF